MLPVYAAMLNFPKHLHARLKVHSAFVLKVPRDVFAKVFLLIFSLNIRELYLPRTGVSLIQFILAKWCSTISVLITHRLPHSKATKHCRMYTSAGVEPSLSTFLTNKTPYDRSLMHNKLNVVSVHDDNSKKTS